MHRRPIAKAGQRRNRGNRIVGPVRIFGNRHVSPSARVLTVKEILIRFFSLMADLGNAPKVGRGLKGVTKLLAATKAEPAGHAVSPLVEERRRPRAAPGIPKTTSTVAATESARNPLHSVTHGSRDRDKILHRFLGIPAIHEMTGIFVERPEIFKKLKCPLTVSCGFLFFANVDPGRRTVGLALRTGEEHIVRCFQLHRAWFVHCSRRPIGGGPWFGPLHFD